MLLFNVVVRSRTPNSVSLHKSNTFFISFAYIFVRAILCFKIECFGRLVAFECGSKLPSATSFL